jgi:hypothetical protein
MVTGTDVFVINEYSTALPVSKIVKVVRNRFVINNTYLEQTYFWSRDWQVGEKEADKDIKLGRIKTFSNAEDTKKYLHSKRKK